MLTHTYIHIPGIGARTEQRFWGAGLLTWEHFLTHPDRSPLNGARRETALEFIRSSRQHLRRGSPDFFKPLMPSSEAWRFYEAFRENCAFVDIETTGLGSAVDHLTVVGVYDGSRTFSFIHGRNLDELPAVLQRYPLLITFNGATFDMPFIRRFFPRLPSGQLHLDLRYPLQRLGYRGGLKAIERKLGVGRDSALDGLDGWDAVRLWHRYCRGDNASLDTLVAYNRSDIENLQPLADFACGTLKKQLLMTVADRSP